MLGAIKDFDAAGSTFKASRGKDYNNYLEPIVQVLGVCVGGGRDWTTQKLDKETKSYTSSTVPKLTTTKGNKGEDI